MPLDLTPDIGARAAELNAAYRHHSAFAVLARALSDPAVGRIALVSSFGAEAVVLLHMVSVMARATPVIFLDTGLHFPETLAYRRELCARLNLENVISLSPAPATRAAQDPNDTLHATAPDACCALRKTAPLAAALSGYDAWITGRKRYQSSTRAALEFFEPDTDSRLKVNPLAHWAAADVQDYRVNNRLPAHPLVARGYPSIGCAPCTSAVTAGDDPRAGRWQGQAKTECGIHFQDGKIVRQESA